MEFEFPNIRHLRAFAEVARLGGISAASDVVHLSQPAITQALSKLEVRLDTALFERITGGMQLTAPGELFLTRVERMLDNLATGVREATRSQNTRSNKGFANFDRLLTSAQLRALIALSEARNFSIAARNIGISQPSIHRAARDLEKLSGLALFRSNSQGVELTLAAAHLARWARLAASEMQQGFYEIETWKGRDSSRIVVGSLPLARTRILPRVMHGLLSEKPGIQIQTIDGPYPELLRGLRYGEIDFLIGALRDPPPTNDVVQEPLFDDALAIVVRAGHPLCDVASLNMEMTLEYPWIAPPKTTPAGSFLSDTLRIPELTKTPVKVVSSSLILVRGLLLEGEYITIISRHQVRHELDQGVLVALPIKLPGNSRPIGLTFRLGWRPTETQARFLEWLRDSVQEFT